MLRKLFTGFPANATNRKIESLGSVQMITMFHRLKEPHIVICRAICIEHFLIFRVLPELNISQLRTEISSQLDADKLPLHYVFVRGVGRHFTEVGHLHFEYLLM